MKKIPCDIMTRTVGYYAVVRQTNPGKKAEIKERHNYSHEDIEKALTKNIKKENISL